jgi:Family of unknown function (DUF5990)
VLVRIEADDLPGRSCAPADAPARYENVHVGLQRGREPVELVPGDAPSATWDFDLVARLGLTDARGHPVCARVRPPAVAWSCG